MKVLIADDHPMVLAGIRTVLAGSAFDVVGTAADGEEALEAVAAFEPDILVLDLQMPKMTGLDVLRRLRADGDKRPAVLLTANLEDSILVEAIRAGVSGIVLKESAQDVLLMCLDSVAEGKRWIDRELLERALDVSLEGGAAGSAPADQFTAKERTLIELVARGGRNREIADELGITEGTVKLYLHRIYQRIGVVNRTGLAMWARDNLS